MITYEQRHLVAHHELHRVAQRRALREVDEVLERERERDVQVHLDAHAARPAFVVVVLRLLRALRFARRGLHKGDDQ